MAISWARTFSTFKGQAIRWRKQQEYISRLRKVKQTLTLNSNFWMGLYGDVWLFSQPFLGEEVEKLMRLNPDKLPFYHRGLKAMNLIQQAL